MEAIIEQAPSVVAVVVVTQPAIGFEQVLEGLAAQDYPNLKTLFLVVGEPGELPAQIHERVPGAFVRAVVDNPGYGAAANEVMRLVEGRNGFFLLMHDDVALDHDAVRVLVEELFRSNAGIVGPKLVDWDKPNVLQHVGLGVDRFGEVDSLVEPGEIDQEQHDAVRDVFCLPSACLLVRADLFHELGGFETSYSFYGDDLDLCWRAHLSGARVVVVPEARARHRERLAQRRPDLPHRVLAAQHRIRTVATLTGGIRLFGVLLQLLVITLLEMAVGIFTGHFADAFASLRSLFGVLPRLFSILRRRRAVAALRQVPNREIAGLQIRGSARFSAYLRTREQRHMAVDHSSIGQRRFTRNSSSQLACWLGIAAIALLGSRSFIGHGVPTVGEFLRFPSSPRQLVGDYLSGWWGHGLGSTTAVPTGVGLIGVAGMVGLGHMGLLHTVAVLAWLPLGYMGAWRMLSIFPSSRARIMGLMVYAALPVAYSAIATGRWSVLAAYGAAPWFVHLLRKFAGIEPALTARADADIADDYVSVTMRERVRLGAQLSLLSAVLFAFAPATALLIVSIGVAFAISGLIARTALIPSALILLGTAIALVGGLLLNLPWSAALPGSTWDIVVGAPIRGGAPSGIRRLLSFSVASGSKSVLAMAFWIPVVAAPLLARGWRLTWAARGALMAVAGLGLAVCSTRGLLPFRLPDFGFFLVLGGLGACLAAATTAAAFEQDVQGGAFGWKQPLGILSGCAIVIGLLPTIVTSGNGHWNTPSLTTEQLLRGFAADPIEGDSHTIFIGDPRVMPVPGWRVDAAGKSGVAFALVDDGALTAVEHWSGSLSPTELDVRNVLGLIASNATARGGRLLAPYAVRYIIIPKFDGVNSRLNLELPLPAGIMAAIESQLDLRPVYGPPNYLVYENTAWIPTRSMLGTVASAASTQAGAEALATTALDSSTPIMVGARDRGPAAGSLTAGLFHVAMTIDEHWSLIVNDTKVKPRAAFGGTAAFEVKQGGVGQLIYTTDSSRRLLVVLQLIAWLVMALFASRVTITTVRRHRMPAPDQSPVLAFDPTIPMPSPLSGDASLIESEFIPPSPSPSPDVTP